MINPQQPPTAVLAGLPFLGEIQEDALRRLAEGASLIDAPRGALIFHPGTPCAGMHAIIRGSVKLSRSAREGSERVLVLASNGDAICAETLFQDLPYRATAEALEDTLLVHLARGVLLAELEHNIILAKAFICLLSGRVADAVHDLETCTLLSARARVAEFLVRHAAAGSCAPETSIRLPASKGVVASRLNLTQEHFSRVLRQLAGEGLIAVRGRDIAIPDMGRLRLQAA